MARLFSLLAWLHVSLAMALATIALLAVPEKAFADSGCADDCLTQWGFGVTGYWNCIAGCCDSEDPGNREACCENYCTPDDLYCVSECKNASVTCVPLDCNTSLCMTPPCVTAGNNCKQTTDSANCGTCKCKGVTTCVCGS